MVTPYVRALKKAIEQYERELTNMKAALAHHEHAEADLEIIRQQGQQEGRAAQRRGPVER